MTLTPPFYMKNIFKLTEIHEYLHGNIKMSNQNLRAPVDSQVTRHTTKGVKDSTNQHPQTKPKGVQIKIEALTC